ncbi:MAG TPA: hypothetical protein PK210_04905 [Bacteroidia bacterium]|nr:hypothetical protein [Bacteroidia bacterium]
MKVSLKKAFSLLDGRLSTEMEDVYEMLNYIFDAKFFTHQIPTAMKTLKDKNPEWFQNGVNIINDIKRTNNTDDFDQLMELINKSYPTYQIELDKIDQKIPFMAGLEGVV